MRRIQRASATGSNSFVREAIAYGSRIHTDGSRVMAARTATIMPMRLIGFRRQHHFETKQEITWVDLKVV
jgi:hypothetical protein